MCELFGIDARYTMRANAQLRTFFEDSPYHPHGWGLAWHEGATTQLHKEPLTAVDSNYLSHLLDEPIRCERLIAHIRNATRGATTYQNCHPFLSTDVSGRRWIIAHNGTILNDGLLTGYDQWIEGTTDSEQVMRFLVDLIEEATTRIGRSLDFGERFVVLSGAMERLSDFNKLNLLIDDDEYTYVHTNTVQDTLFVRQTASAAIFCTRPLEGFDGWQPVPHCRLVAYKHGHMERIAPSHGHAFDNDVYLRMLATA